MGEIGSELWDIPVVDEENEPAIPRDSRWFISGTSALGYIIEDILQTRSIKSVAVPSWCCECMVIPFLRAGIKVVFYPVYYSSGSIVCDHTETHTDCSLVLSYFGYTSQINNIGAPSGIIIRDVTHSIFSEIYDDAEYYFGSLRKWVGVYTGGYAWKKGEWNTNRLILPVSEEYVALRKSAMEQKRKYIDNEIKGKEYLNLFARANDYLDHCGIEGAAERDIEIACKIDMSFIKRRRRENAGILLEHLSEYAIFKSLKEDDCPLFVPILLDNETRNKLKQYLIDKEIYCPAHWPVSEVHSLTEQTRSLYDSELSIICDQRYAEEDMYRIIDEIRRFGL